MKSGSLSALSGFMVLALVCGDTRAQNVGDHVTAGYTPQRTYLNSDAGAIAPPLRLARTLFLPAESEGNTMITFQETVLVGAGGNPASFIQLESDTGSVRGIAQVPSSAAPLGYVPAFAKDIVLLAGSTSTEVQAYQVSTGQLLWNDDNSSEVGGRDPLLIGDLALYHGRSGVTAAKATSGQVFWRFPSTSAEDGVEFAEAPLAVDGNLVYVLESSGSLISLDLLDGSPNWELTLVGSDGSSIITAGRFVFVSNPADSLITAIRAATGAVVWSKETEAALSTSPGIALAYDQLIEFGSRNGLASVAAYEPETGDLMWEVVEPSTASGSAQFGVVGNGMLYFYNSATGRIRILDAFTGNLLWSIRQDDVRALSLSGGLLYVLLADRVLVYEQDHVVYLAQIADGLGASTLFTLVNPGSQAALGQLEFFDQAGLPLPVAVEGLSNAVPVVDFSVPPQSSVKVQTLGESPEVVVGWARASSNSPISATAVFQYSDQESILFEAGVGISIPSGTASTFSTRVSRSAENPFSTGLAIANPLDEPATVTIEFKRRIPSQGTFQTSIELGPGEHTARFTEEFFPDEAALGSEGTLIVESDIPVVITALRTQSGLQMSSYPVAILGR